METCNGDVYNELHESYVIRLFIGMIMAVLFFFSFT